MVLQSARALLRSDAHRSAVSARPKGTKTVFVTRGLCERTLEKFGKCVTFREESGVDQIGTIHSIGGNAFYPTMDIIFTN